MRLRPRQKTFVERSVAALASRGNTLAVAPTGAGKTIMLSAVTGEMIGDGAKACVLAHRDELTAQNRAKFQRVVPGISTSVIDATEKSWGGQVAFAMVPTLARASNLADMPRLDLLVIDEAHHAVADSYRRIIDRVRDANPDARIFGVTATPNRGDKKGLREVFDNVAVTDEVIRHWKEKAGDRQTVIFCSTVAHAEHVTEAFRAAGITAALIHGDLVSDTRKAILADYAAGNIRVIVNVAVLTEGWDHPPTSCVVLLRPSSYKSTMIQMVGRGLRIVDPEEHPGIVKTDCVVLDFGTSSLIHGTLEQDVDLDGKTEAGEAPTKTCPGCGAEIPLAAIECPLCGEVFPREDEDGGEGGGTAPLSGFIMTEIDLLKRSSFAWVDLFGTDDAMMATGFTAWGGIFWLDGVWYAVGGGKGERPHLLGVGERTVCLAQADDWLNTHETDESAFKTRSWLRQPPTEKQLQYLAPECRHDFGLTRYRASALMTFGFNKRAIRQLIDSAASSERRAA
ncbi:MAG: helicase [Rhodobacterales bacterium 12-65-15]|nr:MAG: helicase [Rhodobacterales bacterium 12-65-15]